MKIEYKLKPKSERRQQPFKPDTILPFGQLRTDHMFLMDYVDNNWIRPRIVPYSNLSIAPGANVFHYGQAIFEGAKAFKHPDGEIYAFRIDRNAKRMNRSAELMCMPSIPIEIQIEAILALIDVDRLWCPDAENSSLYIRPFMFGSQDALGIQPSSTYTFGVFLSPSGPYYRKGFKKPIKLLITTKYHRAAPGGVGAAKAAGNYGASMRAGVIAKQLGASQVLYLDATNTYIEEAGSMNHFHVNSDGSLVIPEFTDTILRSITAESVIELAKKLNITVRQKRIKINEFIEGIKNKTIVEAGGLGTAAVISPVGSFLLDDGTEIIVGNGEIGEVTNEIYSRYTAIQTGKSDAPVGWLRKVDRRI